jgi:uncharacterized protein YrrD
MLRSFRNMQGYWMGAVDGRMGEVKDFYFDDQAWTIRYVVVDTGRWLPGRDVLISPAALKTVEWEEGILHTDLTKEQIGNAPSIRADEPVSRQYETDLARYFSWPAYWQSADQEDASTAYLAASGTREQQEQVSRLAVRNPPPEGDPHLRSMHTLVGYTLFADGQDAGQLDDFVIDEQGWIVRYLVANVGSWWAGEKVLVVPHWLDEVDWENRQVRFAASRETISNAPRVDLSQPISREYEDQLHAYYGQARYWKAEGER